MGAVDRAAITQGLPGPWLMENAGRAVTRAITSRFGLQPTLVLCGPGNNGGDGWVVARQLHRAGWPVRVATLVDRAALKGDAAWAAALWAGRASRRGRVPARRRRWWSTPCSAPGWPGPWRAWLWSWPRRCRAVARPWSPSTCRPGCDGATGRGAGCRAAGGLTVTFCRLKPGHLLLPGRLQCGETVLADIGIPDRLVRRHDGGLRANGPAWWRRHLPCARPRATNTASAMRWWSAARWRPPERPGWPPWRRCASVPGLVSIACRPGALTTYAAQLTTVMTKPVARCRGTGRPAGRQALLGGAARARPRRRRRDQGLVAAALAAGRPTVLDADALTSFAADRRGSAGAPAARLRADAARRRVRPPVRCGRRPAVPRAGRQPRLRGRGAAQGGGYGGGGPGRAGGDPGRGAAGAGDGRHRRCAGRPDRRACGPGCAGVRGRGRRGLAPRRGGTAWRAPA